MAAPIYPIRGILYTFARRTYRHSLYYEHISLLRYDLRSIVGKLECEVNSCQRGGALSWSNVLVDTCVSFMSCSSGGQERAYRAPQVHASYFHVFAVRSYVSVSFAHKIDTHIESR